MADVNLLPSGGSSYLGIKRLGSAAPPLRIDTDL